MFSIGEFSKITGLSIKTLRFYHERGVLIPAHVEAATGYRFYDPRNIEVARTIIALREFEFTLEEISEILRERDDESDILDYLEQRKSLLQGRMKRDRAVVSRIDRILHQEREARLMAQQTPFEIEIKELPTLWIGGIRTRGRYDECGKVFGKLGRLLARNIAGPPLCLQYDQEYRESDADFEPCMPLRKCVQADGVDVRQLAGGNAITLIHRGAYSELGRSYERLIRFAKEREYELLVPSREVYIKGPGMIFQGNPTKYLTEIQILFE
ncbi:MAG: MerR family transcriptional regulator [Planctomycetales bacterium]|nr:MerR family transcriptional regulator [Planctomycetales bacterium]